MNRVWWNSNRIWAFLELQNVSPKGKSWQGISLLIPEREFCVLCNKLWELLNMFWEFLEILLRTSFTTHLKIVFPWCIHDQVCSAFKFHSFKGFVWSFRAIIFPRESFCPTLLVTVKHCNKPSMPTWNNHTLFVNSSGPGCRNETENWLLIYKIGSEKGRISVREPNGVNIDSILRNEDMIEMEQILLLVNSGPYNW